MKSVKTINSVVPSVKRPLRFEDLQNVWDGLAVSLSGDTPLGVRIISGFWPNPDGSLSAGCISFNGELWYHPDTVGRRITPTDTVYFGKVPSGDLRTFDDSTTRDMSFDNLLFTDPNLGGINLGQPFSPGNVAAWRVAWINDKSIAARMIADGAVGSAALAAAAVLTDKVANAAITLEKMANASVGTNQLVDGSVTDAKIDPARGIQGYHIQTDTLPGEALVDNSVWASTKLVDNSITTQKYEDGSVTGVKMADQSITGGKLVERTIPLGKLEHVPFFLRCTVNAVFSGTTFTGWTIDNALIQNYLQSFPEYLELYASIIGGIPSPPPNSGFDISFPPSSANRWIPASVVCGRADIIDMYFTNNQGFVEIRLRDPAIYTDAYSRTVDVYISGWVRKMS